MFKKYCLLALTSALLAGFVIADDDDEERREKAEEMREKYKERHEDDDEDRREEAEEMREKYKERHQDDREKLEKKHKHEKHSKEAKGKHKDKAKKPKDMHGRDWAAEKGKKHGWEDGKPAKYRDRDDDDRDHDHDHESDHDDRSPETRNPEQDVAESQDPEQTLRDMAKDTAARKAGAEKGSASEALIHMGTDAILDRAKGGGGQSQ